MRIVVRRKYWYVERREHVRIWLLFSGGQGEGATGVIWLGLTVSRIFGTRRFCRVFIGFA
jgi:hypothetical protein